jgi:hypothetical protein
MHFPTTFKACTAWAAALALAGIGACGGGGSGSANNAGSQTASSGGAASATAASSPTAASAPANASTGSATSNLLNLSTAVQSQPVAVDAAASGMLASAGVAALYMAASRPFLTAALAGAPAVTTHCASGGTLATVTSNAGSPGVRAGESATVTFAQCVGELAIPAVSSSSAISGSASFQIQSVQGVVGSPTADWSYTATETVSEGANALELASPTATTTFSGTVTFTVTYNAATGSTTTTANAPAITIGRTQLSSSGTTLDGSISVSGLSWTEQESAAAAEATLTAAAAVSVGVDGVTLAFNVSTPAALTVANGRIVAGTQQLTTSDTTESIVAQNASTFVVTVTSGGSTGTWTESASALSV